MIQQNAVTIDGQKVADQAARVAGCGELLIKVGKRRFCRVIFS